MLGNIVEMAGSLLIPLALSAFIGAFAAQIPMINTSVVKYYSVSMSSKPSLLSLSLPSCHEP